MKYSLSILLLTIVVLPCMSQGRIGTWTDYLSYNSSRCLAAGNNKVFSSAGNSIMIKDLENNTLSSMSRITGLTETEISTIGWSDNENCLIIAYVSSNIDIVKDNSITNIPDIERKYIPGLKEINRIRTDGNYAYLASSFGIVIIDLVNMVITDTWKPGSDSDANEVYDLDFLDGIAYAATATGVYYADTDKTGLSYFDNWDKFDALPSASYGYSSIAAIGDKLYTGYTDSYSGNAIFYMFDTNGNVSQFHSEENTTIRSIEAGSNELTITTSHAINRFSATGEKINSVSEYPWGSSPDSQHAIFYQGQTWIADKSIGLVTTPDFISFSNIALGSPYTNHVADIYIDQGVTYITGGSVSSSWGNVYRAFELFSHEEERWNNVILYNEGDRDAMRVVSDPDNKNHCFVSSWGNGIYEYLEGKQINHYNQYNSPLTSIISGEPYSRVCGIAFDKEHNLWMTQSGVAGNLKMLKDDGSWMVTNINLDVPTVGDMLIASNGFIWVILPRGHGLMVYDPGDIADDTGDDKYLMLQVETSEGSVFTNIFSIAEDLDGNIWVGTDAGPLVYYSPEKAMATSVKANRIKVPRNDGSGLADYLLHTETISTIAIDGANRKWFGTINSGAYLVSEDCMTQIHHFSMDNSPLFDDQITKIAIDGDNGEVWIGTATGTLSYRGDATTGRNDYTEMYAFPNPVRENFDGLLTITGLVENTTLKITDISGNLVYEAVSKGGQVTWDLKGYRGRRVSTGVYLVFATNSDGTLTGVTKVLIIN